MQPLFRTATLLTASVLSLSVFSVNAFAAALPKNITLKYEVIKNDLPFANVKEQYTVTGDTYKINSVTKGVGVYALFGERKLSSTGMVTKAGLVPNHFELHQGDNAKKSLIADFDWKAKQIVMQVKGKQRTAALQANTQDLISYAYQFMHQTSVLKSPLKVNLTTGKRVKQYVYNVAPQTLNIDGEDIETIHLSPLKNASDKPTKETKEFWLSKKHHYLPVYIVLVDKHGQKLEQTLLSIDAK